MAPRPAVAAPRARVAVALLESSMLVVLAALASSGALRPGAVDDLPLRVGPSALPSLLVAALYGLRRALRPRASAGRLHPFVAAGALALGLGAALAPGLGLAERLRDALAGGLTGAIALGWFMPLHQRGDLLLSGQVDPWNELYMGAALVFLGSMPSALVGGFVLALLAQGAGLALLARGLRFDLAAPGDRAARAGALARSVIAAASLLLGAGLCVVGPLISLKILRLPP